MTITPAAGRKPKEKLDYFSHDVNMRNDEGLAYMMAKYRSPVPYAAYTMLLEMIYGSANGYFIFVNERLLVLLSEKIYFTFENTETLLREMIIAGLWDQEKYQQYNVLTSKSLQSRYMKIVQRRKSLTLVAELLLINPYNEIESGYELKKNQGIQIVNIDTIINVTSTPINVTSTPIPVTLNDQREREKKKNIYLSLDEIFENKNVEQIPQHYKNYLALNPDYNRAEEIEKIQARLGGGNMTTERHNALVDCLEIAKTDAPGPAPDKRTPITFEEAREKLTGQIWQEAVCATRGFDIDQLAEFTRKWLETKRLVNGWQWPSSHLATYLIDDFEKHLRKNGKTTKRNSNKSHGLAQNDGEGFGEL